MTCLDRRDDAALQQFEYAKRRFGYDWTVCHADVQTIDETSLGTLDIVFCAGVLHHLKYPLVVLERLRRTASAMPILETAGMIPAPHGSFPRIALFPGDQAAVAAGGDWGDGGGATVAWIRAAWPAADHTRVEIKYTPSFAQVSRLRAFAVDHPRHGRVFVHADP